MPSYDDLEWVRGIKSEDEKVLDALWQTLYELATKIAYKRAHDWGVDRDDMLDLAYTALLTTYTRITKRAVYQFKFLCPFIPYCRTILSNELNHELRKNRHRFQQTPLDNEELLSSEEDDRISISAEELYARLEPCLNKLTPQRRKILLMRYLESKRVKQIADELNMLANTVTQTLRRSRKEMKKCLQKRGFADSGELLS